MDNSQDDNLICYISGINDNLLKICNMKTLLSLLIFIWINNCEPSTYYSKDKNGKLTYRIETSKDCSAKIYDERKPPAHLIGHYDSKVNKTYDEQGNFFGTGNKLTQLLK